MASSPLGCAKDICLSSSYLSYLYVTLANGNVFVRTVFHYYVHWFVTALIQSVPPKLNWTKSRIFAAPLAFSYSLYRLTVNGVKPKTGS
jgi:hypothetical protein